jgi:hypothetical protein
MLDAGIQRRTKERGEEAYRRGFWPVNMDGQEHGHRTLPVLECGASTWRLVSVELKIGRQ